VLGVFGGVVQIVVVVPHSIEESIY